MRLPRHFAFVALLALLVTALSPSLADAQTRSRRVSGSAETAPVIKLLAGRPTGETLAALATFRIPAVAEADRADLMRSMPRRFTDNVLDDSDATVSSLKQRLKPVLSLHGRDGTLAVYVYRDPTPEVLSVPGAFVAFSTGMIDFARSDGALMGVAASELAREYFALPSAYANYSENAAVAREQTLNRDAVAVASLLALKQKPGEYRALLDRLHGLATADTSPGDHAALDAEFTSRMAAFDRLEVTLKKPNKAGVLLTES
ncbi:MAG: hypothetical protein ACJ74Q_15695 [Pyrinomonadaceae bacterium]